MARLPQPGGDAGNWGSILNDYLSTSHKTDGSLRDSIITSDSIQNGAVQEASLTPAVQIKLNQAAPTWATLSGKPSIVAGGTDQTSARASVDAVGKGEVVVNIIDFGASPSASGATNAAAIQNAIDSISGRGAIWIPPRSFPFDGTVTVPSNISIFSNNGRLEYSNSAKIVFGNSGARTVCKAWVKGVNFWRNFTANSTAPPSLGSTTFIEYDRCREIRVSECVFNGADKAIYARPNAASAEHDNAMIVVENNQFSEVNYAWYADRHTSGAVYTNSDSKFKNNIVNRAYITHVYLNGIDGWESSGNVLFFPNYASPTVFITLKQHNYHFAGLSGWVSIGDDHCFEAGTEAILFEQARAVSIVGTQIAWCGQNTMSSAIKITGDAAMELVTSGLILDSYTKHGIEIDGGGLAVSIGPSAVRYDGSAVSYKGAAALNTIAHYRYVTLDTYTGPIPVITDGYSANGGESDKYANFAYTRRIERTQRWGGRTSASLGFTVVASTPFSTFRCANIFGVTGAGATFTGTIKIVAKRSDSSAAKNAYYVLDVARTPAGTFICNQRSSVGLTSGAAVDEPSFTWAFTGPTGAALVATPIGSSVAGAFTFWADTDGDLLLY